MTFALVAYDDGKPRVGVLSGDRLADATAALSPLLDGDGGMLAVLTQWDAAFPLLEQLGDDIESGKVESRPLAQVRLRAPLSRPVNLYCAFAVRPDSGA
jgi:hypothetical protein